MRGLLGRGSGRLRHCAPRAGSSWSGWVGCAGLKAKAAWCGSSAWPAPTRELGSESSYKFATTRPPARRDTSRRGRPTSATSSTQDAAVFSYLGTHGGRRFRRALNFVGLDFYPGSIYPPGDAAGGQLSGRARPSRERLLGPFNISDYRWFNLRDSASNPPATLVGAAFSSDGLLRADYTASRRSAPTAP